MGTVVLMTTSFRSDATSSAIVVNGVDQVTVKDTGVLTVRTPGVSGNDVMTVGQSKINYVGSQSTSSGTAKEWAIPATAKRITVLFFGVSTNGNSPLMTQVSSGGVYKTTGYACSTCFVTTAATCGVVTSGVGFSWGVQGAALSLYGELVLTLVDPTVWLAKGQGQDANSSTHVTYSGGVLTTGVLDRVRILATNGTDAFDTGLVNVSWE